MAARARPMQPAVAQAKTCEVQLTTEHRVLPPPWTMPSTGQVFASRAARRLPNFARVDLGGARPWLRDCIACAAGLYMYPCFVVRPLGTLGRPQ